MSGDISIGVKRLTKTFRALDGTIRKLYSYDGVTWSTNDAKVHRRLKVASNLHGKKWAKAKAKQFEKLTTPSGKGVEDRPVILPVTKRNPTFLGRDKGKAHKYRRDLKRKKKEPNVEFMRSVHYHLCRHPDHGGRLRFVCSCDHKWQSRFCGGKECLYSLFR